MKPVSIANGISSFIKKYYLDLLSTLVLSLTLFLFFPIQIYQKNLGAIRFNLTDILFLLIALALTAFIVTAVLSISVHKFLYEYIAIVITSIIVCFWVQGNLLIYNLGKLDGHVIDWSKFNNKFIIEIIIWIGLITAGVWFRKFLYKNLKTLLVILLIFEIVPLLTTYIAQSFFQKTARNTHIYFDYQHEFEFSSNKNVIIIVLDTARVGAFQQILARSPSYQDTFKDFTFFNNASSGYPTTEPSIPLILSGEYTDNSIPFTQFLEDTQNNSLPALLKTNAYTVESYSFTPFAYSGLWQNVRQPTKADLLKFTNQLYLTTFLRFLPLPLKPYIIDQYYKGRNYTGKDMVDLYNNASKTTKVDKGPVFKFIHLTGAHPPFTVGASLQLTSDATFVDQLEGGLLAVDRLLQGMKSAGVYDNSLIMVMGDHGTAFDAFLDKNEINQPLSTVMFFGRPLLMAKDFNQEQREFKISNVPVSLADVSKTVMEVLKLKNNLPGLSIFSDIPENRSRIFYYYEWQRLDWNSEFLPPLYKFEINGNAYDSHSWQFTGREIESSGQVNLINYKYGEDIVAKGNLFFDLFSIGFSDAWATGPYSCINLPLAESNNEPLALTFSVLPFLVKDHLPKQQINVLADNQLISTTDLKELTQLTIPLPANLTNDKELDLCFEFPDAKYSPSDLGINTDPRFLGGLFKNIIVEELIPSVLPFEINFGLNSDTAKCKSTGWSSPEPEFTWTDGQEAKLVLPLLSDGAEKVKLTVSAIPFLSGKILGQQLVIIRSNGIELGRWTMDHEGEYVLDIPSAYIHNGILNIEFEIPNAVSLSGLGVSQDTRALGVAIRWIRIEK